MNEFTYTGNFEKYKWAFVKYFEQSIYSGWKVETPCIDLCRAINLLPGIVTIESCYGHKECPPAIYLRVTSVDRLYPLRDAINSWAQFEIEDAREQFFYIALSWNTPSLDGLLDFVLYGVSPDQGTDGSTNQLAGYIRREFYANLHTM